MPLADGDVQSTLGTACKNNASFYVCHEKESKFLGCCSIDPCKTDDGQCPDDDLQYSSYDTFSHNAILGQECQSDRPDVQWWTCGTLDMPFMGCCSTNPCAEEDGCPSDSLFPAKLSDDPEHAAAFLPEEVRDSYGKSGGGGGLSKGAIGGIAAGAVVGGLLIIGALVWFFLRRRKAKQVNSTARTASVYEPYANQTGSMPPPSEGPGSPQMNKVDGFPPYSPYPSTYSPTPNPSQSPPYWHANQQSPPMAPSTWSGASPDPSQGTNHFRDSMQTSYTSHTTGAQTFAQELPATAEYTPQGHTHMAEMEATEPTAAEKK